MYCTNRGIRRLTSLSDQGVPANRLDFGRPCLVVAENGTHSARRRIMFYRLEIWLRLRVQSFLCPPNLLCRRRRRGRRRRRRRRRRYSAGYFSAKVRKQPSTTTKHDSECGDGGILACAVA